MPVLSSGSAPIVIPSISSIHISRVSSRTSMYCLIRRINSSTSVSFFAVSDSFPSSPLISLFNAFCSSVYVERSFTQISSGIFSATLSSFGIMSMPTLAVVKGGKVVNISVGAKPKEAIFAML